MQCVHAEINVYKRTASTELLLFFTLVYFVLLLNCRKISYREKIYLDKLSGFIHLQS